MTRPTREQSMMEMAETMSRRSTCARAKVGCIITDYDMTRVYAMGHNGGVRGGANGCASPDKVGGCGCVHAEANALVKLSTEAQGLVLFTTVSPCEYCAKLIVNQGHIRAVRYRHQYRDVAPILLLHNHSLSCVQVHDEPA
jgi:deoxycytidylate deaminase